MNLTAFSLLVFIESLSRPNAASNSSFHDVLTNNSGVERSIKVPSGEVCRVFSRDDVRLEGRAAQLDAEIDIDGPDMAFGYAHKR
jgi:hypothetical protein